MTAREVVETLDRWADGYADGTLLCSRRKWSGERRCTSPATLLLTGMCVHEHVSGPTPYCADHAERDACRRRLACVACRESSEPHFCLVSVVDSKPIVTETQEGQ